MTDHKLARIDIVEARNDLPALTMQLDGGLTLVEMDYGHFGLTVSTPHLTRLAVVVDGAEALKERLEPGIHHFGGDAFRFSQPAKALPEQQAEKSVSQPDRDLAELCHWLGLDDDEPPVVAPPFIGGPTGRLELRLVYLNEDLGDGDTPKEIPFYSQTRRFQFNPPLDHARAVAQNVHRIQPLIDADEAGEGKGAVPANWCGCKAAFS